MMHHKLVQDGSCPPTDRDSKDVVMIPTVFISLLQGLWTPVDYQNLRLAVLVTYAIALVTLPSLYLSGCSGIQSTQNEDPESAVSQAVEATLTAIVPAATNTLAPTETVASTPTATALPPTATETRVPTSTPEPTATVEPTHTAVPPITVPNGWVEYSDVGGEFSMMCPGTWERDGRQPRILGFNAPNFYVYTVGLIAGGTFGEIGDSAVIDALVEVARDQAKPLDTFKIVDTGVIDTPIHASFVRYTIQSYGSETTGDHMIGFMPVSEQQFLLFMGAHVNNPISEQKLEEFLQAMATVQVQSALLVQTATPEATTIPTPTIAVPSSWAEYTDVTQAFKLNHPGAWTLDGQEPGAVTFGAESHYIFKFQLFSWRYGEVGEAKAIEDLVDKAKGSCSPLDTITIARCGTLDAPVPANYVRYTVKDFVNASEIMLVYLNVDEGHSLLAMVGHTAHPLGEQQIKDFLNVAATFRLQ